MDFLATMPPPVHRQRDVLAAMRAAVDAEPALRWFELGCSLGRGAGDELSDIDCGVGVADDRWPDALDLAERLAATGGPRCDEMRQVFPGPDSRTCWHVVTLYEDGLQLSLVLTPATWRTGLPPGSVALADKDGRLATAVRPPSADTDAAELREWAALAWIALGDAAKYLDRGSPWEADARLHEARTMVFRLWAAGGGVDFARFGLTALLDEPAPDLPPGIEATIATLDPDDQRRAARALAAVLAAAIDRVAPALAAASLGAPDGLAAWVGTRLRD